MKTKSILLIALSAIALSVLPGCAERRTVTTTTTEETTAAVPAPATTVVRTY